MGLVLINSLVALLYFYWWLRTLQATQYSSQNNTVAENTSTGESTHLTTQLSNKDIPNSESNKPNVENCSILVPFRNEALRLQPLLDSILTIHSAISWEVLFINDNSTDNSCLILDEWIQKNPHINAQVTNSCKPSKKQAILTGVLLAKYDWILTTDADCKLPIQLLDSHAAIANSNTTVKCIIGRVEFFKTTQKHQPLNTYEILENQVMVAIGLSAAKNAAPVAANGANLFFHKATWLELGGITSHENIASGDDIFTTHLFYQWNPSSIAINNTIQGVIKAQLCDSLSQFIHQRIRWFKKSFLQKTQKTLFQQSFFGFYLLSLWVLTLVPVYGEYALLAIIPIPTKILLDTWFGYKLLRYHRYSINILWISCASLSQILFLPLLGLASPLLSYQWKARKISV
ncbi:MAG: glycosyltransferase [Bacteroidota bacterium]|jgi:glycosyltransferase involved in cell wall biosynthesis